MERTEREHILSVLTAPHGFAGNDRHIPADLQRRVHSLCAAYNRTGPEDEDERRRIIGTLFGKAGDLVFIEPDFRCDYGFNIHFHGMAFLNYNVVILDTSPVHIGDRVFIAPGTCLSCAGHSLDARQRSEGIGTSVPIVIEDDVWLGANVTGLCRRYRRMRQCYRGRQRGHPGHTRRSRGKRQPLPGHAPRDRGRPYPGEFNSFLSTG